MAYGINELQRREDLAKLDRLERAAVEMQEAQVEAEPVLERWESDYLFLDLAAPARHYCRFLSTNSLQESLRRLRKALAREPN